VNQEYLFQPVPSQRLEQFSKEELIQFIEAQERVIQSVVLENQKIKARNEELKQKVLFVDEQFIVLKNKFFSKSSEREPSLKEQQSNLPQENKKRKVKVQLPSLRYPNAPLIERHVELQELPVCDCCSSQMKDTGMTEDAEFLTVVPKQFIIVKQLRHVYGCSKCHGSLKTAPAPKRITPGSSMSDEMVIDVALSKYCDLIPIERYANMAGREGLKDLPPQSLIESTHHLADFISKAYVGLKNEILNAQVLHGDETPHRMLEGDEKERWYLWGFSTQKTSYFEIRNTRSGEVASDLLNKSKCEYLVSDVYSGYGKAVRETNIYRQKLNELERPPPLKNVYCNAHVRRKFKAAKDKYLNEAQFYLDQYKCIYHLEEQRKEYQSSESAIHLREQMVPYFKAMRDQALADLSSYPEKSLMGKSIRYFLKNYEEFTYFTKNIELPIDNNSQERLLRSPVIGRKTWYGNHSKRGALTTAILFSLVETCKLIGVNPREYFKKLIEDLHAGKPAYTPSQFITQ